MNQSLHFVNRRSLIRSAALLPFVGIADSVLGQDPQGAKFALPALPYPFAALEPHIDAETMQIHHDRHHQTYINNLNAAIEKVPVLASVETPEGLIRHIEQIPEQVRVAIRNNAGGHSNHSLFWRLMKPAGGGPPTGALADGIAATFGSYDNFKTAFEAEGLKRFGSGWVWLVANKGRKLEIVSTPNQDSPIMTGAVPVLGNDLWEHAYYLKYRNKRADYLKAWWNTINWETANEQLKLSV